MSLNAADTSDVGTTSTTGDINNLTQQVKQAVRLGGRHNMPPPRDLDLLTLKSVCESHVTWGTPVQSFVFLGLLVFELEPMYATSDGRRSPLNAPAPPMGRGHNNTHNTHTHSQEHHHIIFTHHTLVWKIGTVYWLPFFLSKGGTDRLESLHDGIYRSGTDLLPLERYTRSPKSKILGLNFCYLITNISKTVCCSITCQIELTSAPQQLSKKCPGATMPEVCTPPP